MYSYYKCDFAESREDEGECWHVVSPQGEILNEDEGFSSLNEAEAWVVCNGIA